MKKIRVSSINELDRVGVMLSILSNAQDFSRASQILRKHNQHCVGSGEQPVFTVDIVNLAFAIELFLKALLCGVGKKVRGHKMNELFACLPEEKQMEIKEAFNNHLVKTKGHSQDLFRLKFEDRLEQYANTYDYWRYFHEKKCGTFDSRFCEDLSLVLNEMATTEAQSLWGKMRLSPDLRETSPRKLRR